ncbi:MAG TPA: EamA family transporter [Anaerolineaceae bacterium]|nr:EamA family transporter [Anaerolineaceae bacterium]HPN52117.1 EamA family transporter [Anaerolineaceae bacterium]
MKHFPFLFSSRPHLQAVLQALLVTFLWSTSWVLIKLGLRSNLPALTFAGLRYSLAFLCLLPVALAGSQSRQTLCQLPRKIWLQLAVLGLVYYTLTQGAQFLSLAFLPAATLNLLLNFTPLLVALLGSLAGAEAPSKIQWGGIGLALVGTAVYFFPLAAGQGSIPGLAAALVCLAANAASALLGRRVNTETHLAPVLVTTVSMGVGGLVLLAAGGFSQGFPALDAGQWLIIGWLALVNTAAAFTLWNHTQRTLTAVESSIINSTMLPQIAVLAWLFLDEPLGPRQIAGLALVGAGMLVVQLRRAA